ncbi:unnamed protein product [marine sediment metagenome]|uniref:Uncharacterized protein n=1 Tax=marine sediment metagenome TaxID=412755 RepID=X1G9V3_9ZZZZ
MLFISKKNLEKIRKAEYQKGLALGYNVGLNRLILEIALTKMEEEVSEIIKESKF